jgi:NCS1 nucleoside transporter family
MEKTALEKFGLEPIPKEQKNTRWHEYAIIQFSFSTNSGNFLVPALSVLEGGLSFGWALLSTLVGASLAFYIVSIMALPGSKYSIPAQYGIRALLGIKGAIFISSPMRAITSMYWFAVQTIGGTLVIQTMVDKIWGISLPFLPISLSLSIFMSILAVVGFEAVRNMTRYGLPILVTGGMTILIVFLTSAQPTFHLGQVWDSPHATNLLSAKIFYAGLAFIQYLSAASSSADLSRYARSNRDSHWGLFIGNVLGFTFTAILAIYAAIAAGGWNPYVVAYQTTDNKLVMLIIFLSAMMSMILINMNNAYSGGFSILNGLPDLGRIKSTICFCLLSIVLCCFPSIVEEAKKYISLLGLLVGPIIGVIFTEFVVIQKRRLNLNVLTGNYYYNKKGIVVILIGVIAAILLPSNWPVGFITFVTTALAYGVWGRVQPSLRVLEESSSVTNAPHS